MALSQTELVQKTKTFTTNGALAAIGYDPAALTSGGNLAKIAIKTADPTNSGQLLELLGLA